MKIDIKKYLFNYIGDTSWYGESNHDELSSINLDKLDEVLIETEKFREKLTPLELAIMFHNTYEELAPKFNYETRKDTKEFDENSNNGKLMIAVCSKLLDLIKENE